MVVGFTGTHTGMTLAQRVALEGLLLQHRPTHFHHGDCVGADAQAAELANELGILVVRHPPLNTKMQAHTSWGVAHAPQAYGVRNQDIVDACDVLIATPTGPETRRSGTWWTVRMARRAGKSIQVIQRDGRVVDGRPGSYLETY